MLWLTSEVASTINGARIVSSIETGQFEYSVSGTSDLVRN